MKLISVGILAILVVGLTGCVPSEPMPVPTVPSPTPTPVEIRSFDPLPAPEGWERVYPVPNLPFDHVDKGETMILTSYRVDVPAAKSWVADMMASGWSLMFESEDGLFYSAELVKEGLVACADVAPDAKLSIFSITPKASRGVL